VCLFLFCFLLTAALKRFTPSARRIFFSRYLPAIICGWPFPFSLVGSSCFPLELGTYVAGPSFSLSIGKVRPLFSDQGRPSVYVVTDLSLPPLKIGSGPFCSGGAVQPFSPDLQHVLCEVLPGFGRTPCPSSRCLLSGVSFLFALHACFSLLNFCSGSLTLFPPTPSCCL